MRQLESVHKFYHPATNSCSQRIDTKIDNMRLSKQHFPCPCANECDRGSSLGTLTCMVKNAMYIWKVCRPMSTTSLNVSHGAMCARSFCKEDRTCAMLFHGPCEEHCNEHNYHCVPHRTPWRFFVDAMHSKCKLQKKSCIFRCVSQVLSHKYFKNDDKGRAWSNTHISRYQLVYNSNVVFHNTLSRIYTRAAM